MAESGVADGRRGILFAGDPHRNFAPILRACLARPAGTLILLGDCDCPAPLGTVLAPAIAAGWDIRWILGNHDTETEAAFDNLTQAEGDLGLRVCEIGGYRIAGLPQGPISSPGEASLLAVAHPAVTEALYFVADGSGGHLFAVGLEEHNRNVGRSRGK